MAKLSKDDIMRRAWVEHNKVIFEASSALSPSAAASAAAGAGAGGSGNRTTVSTSNQAILFYNYDSGENILNYFVYNYGTKTLSDFKEVTLYNSPNNSPVTEGGFFLYANNSDDTGVDMIFIDLSGNIIWQDSSDNTSDVDITNFTRYVGAYYLKDGNWKLVLFDKDSTIKTFNFGENPIEGGGYYYDNVWSGGIVVQESIGTIRRYHIVNFSQGTKTQFYEVDNDLGDTLSVYQYAYSDKILTIKNGDLWEVFSSDGQLLSSFDVLTEFSTASWSDYEFTFLDDNGSFLIFGVDNETNDFTVILYSGIQNSFSKKVVDYSEFPSYDLDVDNQKNYDSTQDWKADGSAIFLFYDNAVEPDNITRYDLAKLLPVWSSDSELRDFYTFSSGPSFSTSKGLNNNLDDSQVSFSRSSDHICLLIENEVGDSNYSILRLNRTGDIDTITETDIPITRELYDDDQINGKTILQFERGLTASGTWGWNDLSDVEDRFYYSFYQANNEEIGNYVEDQELILKDVVNDEYWAVKFLYWEQGGGGGFEYTRQLISGGTYSGDIIHYTFSSWLQQGADVISPGVLEIRRGEYGPIYNSAKEGESNGQNPAGTLWNSQWAYNPSTAYNYKWWETDGTNPTNSTAFNAFFSGTPTASGRANGDVIDWTDSSGKPGYLPEESFAWQVDCLLKVEVAGSYLFNTSSDDGNQLSIDGSVVTEFYGGRGMTNSETSSPIELTVGFHNFRYRMQQGGGGSGARVMWQGPEDGTFSVIPSSNLVLNDPIDEYDHYIVSTEGLIIGSVSTGDNYNNEFEGKTHILEDRVFNKVWVSNTENSGNWTLLDRYYEEFDDVSNIISTDGIRKGILLSKNGFNYRVVTEESVGDNIVVPSPGSIANKIEDDDIFHKGFWVRTDDESYQWLRFYNMDGVLIDSIQTEGDFNNFNSWTYGDRCVLTWEKDGTERVAIFNGESVIQLDTGYPSINIVINDYIWWD
ncbi:hypothetical protein EBU71_09015 [bacterium]|nr:hypothetical protein [Candidatus Elulimicrobium humile]